MKKKFDLLRFFQNKRLYLFLCIIGIIEVCFLAYTWIYKSDERQICASMSAQETKLCWEKAVTDRIKKGDIDGAFRTISLLYDQNPTFSDTCHSLTHEIGAAAFRLFSRDADFVVSPKTAYCSYGFYHGFMEALVISNTDISKAGDFCAYVDRQLASITPDVTLQCFHGIGHGTVNNHDPRTWGNEQSLIDPAIALCEKVSKTDDQRSRCATGVFNGISVFYSTGEYKVSVNKSDPLWICRQQKPEYQDACYISLNTLLLELTGGDFLRAAQFVEAISDTKMAQHAMINIASPMARSHIHDTDHSDILRQCRAVSSRLHMACIQGYGYGFLEHGAPEKEYIASLNFCKNQQLTQDEQNACFEYILSYLPMWYGTDKVEKICATLPENLQKKCYTYN